VLVLLLEKLASVHKCLRLCDLCKELAFGAAAQKGEVAIFIQLVCAQPVVPPVPGKSLSEKVGQFFFAGDELILV
jgi:hypothetical protein